MRSAAETIVVRHSGGNKVLCECNVSAVRQVESNIYFETVKQSDIRMPLLVESCGKLSPVQDHQEE